ncbi:hypothetical protein V6N11_016222 [Hibiscus sabdariffa]|uniref:Transmembrane protein n=1 Tax=Hibiscus sabdariffa TaxID=183260 RepID=A0ABR2TUN7_9ROSI
MQLSHQTLSNATQYFTTTSSATPPTVLSIVHSPGAFVYHSSSIPSPRLSLFKSLTLPQFPLLFTNTEMTTNQPLCISLDCSYLLFISLVSLPFSSVAPRGEGEKRKKKNSLWWGPQFCSCSGVTSCFLAMFSFTFLFYILVSLGFCCKLACNTVH